MTFDLSTSAGVTAFAGALVALVFILVPPARHWFVDQDAETQRALTGLMILIVAALAVASSCFGLFGFVACTVQSIIEYFVSVVFAAVLGLATSRGVFMAARIVRSRTDSTTKALSSEQPKLLD